MFSSPEILLKKHNVHDFFSRTFSRIVESIYIDKFGVSAFSSTKFKFKHTVLGENAAATRGRERRDGTERSLSLSHSLS